MWIGAPSMVPEMEIPMGSFRLSGRSERLVISIFPSLMGGGFRAPVWSSNWISSASALSLRMSARGTFSKG